MKVVRCRRRHLEALRATLQREQADAAEDFSDPGYIRWLLRGEAWALVDGNETLAAAGVLPKWQGSVLGWALLSSGVAKPSRFLRLSREVKAFLGLLLRPGGVERVETPVRTDFEAGHRWAKFLGFREEGVMHKFWPGGVDCTLYAKVV